MKIGPRTKIFHSSKYGVLRVVHVVGGKKRAPGMWLHYTAMTGRFKTTFSAYMAAPTDDVGKIAAKIEFDNMNFKRTVEWRAMYDHTDPLWLEANKTTEN